MSDRKAAAAAGRCKKAGAGAMGSPGKAGVKINGKLVSAMTNGYLVNRPAEHLAEAGTQGRVGSGVWSVLRRACMTSTLTNVCGYMALRVSGCKR